MFDHLLSHAHTKCINRMQDMEDQPSISQAMKNFFAMRLAEKFAGAGLLHACAKAVLQSASAFEMPDHMSWGAIYPQQADQTAASRIEQLAEYKVAHAVWKVVKGNASAKPTAMLGRRWLSLVWPELRSAVLTRASAGGISEELFSTFLQGFEEEMSAESQVRCSRNRLIFLSISPTHLSWNKSANELRPLAVLSVVVLGNQL
eukprot:SAG11_NODE_1387_length_5065_cov_12.530099_3_plen_203_part_00